MANQAVYGIVANRAKAERLIQSLVDAGANPHDISILSSQGNEFSEFASGNTSGNTSGNMGGNAGGNTGGSMGTNRNWRTEERVTDYPSGITKENLSSTGSTTGHHNGSSGKGGLGTEKHTKAPEGATTGATTGGIIGGVLGLLAGIGALAIPGMGPFIAAGPLMATLSGIGAGGTLGGIIGGLVGLGIPEFEAKRYESRLKEGGILISVRANNDELAKRFKDVLQKNGAEDVTISSEATTSKNYNKK